MSNSYTIYMRTNFLASVYYQIKQILEAAPIMGLKNGIFIISRKILAEVIDYEKYR